MLSFFFSAEWLYFLMSPKDGQSEFHMYYIVFFIKSNYHKNALHI